MPGINLLPPWLIEKQRARRLVFWLACTQGVIIIMLALVFWLLLHSVEQKNILNNSIERLLMDERFTEPDRIAELLNAQFENDMVFPVELSPFSVEWLTEINKQRPEHIELTGIEINGPFITLLCLAGNWDDASFYRDALLDSDGFAEARFGMFTVMDDGFIHFELNLWAAL